MAKRFVDTELDDKPWFTVLSCRMKCAVQFVFRKCDNAGIWEPNYPIAAAYIGEGGFTEDELLAIDGGRQFEKLKDGKIWVIGFCDFQYGKLSEDCKPHRPVIVKLKKYGLYERVLKGFDKGLQTFQEKDKEKEKVMDKGGAGGNEPYPPTLVQELARQFLQVNEKYPLDQESDFPAIRAIAEKIFAWLNLPGLFTDRQNAEAIKRRWGELITYIRSNNLFSGYSLHMVNKHFQMVAQSFLTDGKKGGTYRQQPNESDHGGL